MVNLWFVNISHLLFPADPKDLANKRSKGRLAKQRSLLRQVSLRDDIVSEPNLSSEADSVAGSTVSVNVGGSQGATISQKNSRLGGSLRSIAAAKLLRKSGICESCVQVASFSGQNEIKNYFHASIPGNAA